MLLVCLAVLAAAPTAGLPAQGLQGGNAFKVAAFEKSVFDELNKGRGDAKKPTFTMDDGLRNFARRYAQLAATNEKAAAQIDVEIKDQKLASRGYRYQYVAGNDAATAAKQVKVDLDVPAKAGIGAYWVPAKEPYFQVLVLLAVEADPMEGKTGLTPAQTDPVMSEAAGRIKSTCYDPALTRNPNLKGDFIVQLVIADQGAVASQKVLTSLGDSELDACALNIIKSLRFPEPYKGKAVTLNHPMHFVPPQGDKIIGFLTRAQIDATFQTAAQDLRSCYDTQRKMKPSLSGVVALSMDINVGGGVDAINVTSNDTGSGELAGCIVKRAYGLHFPPPRYSAPLTIAYPLRFVPDK